MIYLAKHLFVLATIFLILALAPVMPAVFFDLPDDGWWVLFLKICFSISSILLAIATIIALIGAW